MGNRNKARGYELERETVLHWQNLGLECNRVFGSGAFKNQLGDNYEGDLLLAGFTVECKRKKSGFKLFYDSLAQADADMLVVREDRNERLYVMRDATVEPIFRQLGRIQG